ncbi:MAG: helix-turn-helix transcriptional regulator [Deltaproteobacteria bacterium]|nr:helix-turn-helix transcriptional regulator [Deltaproteobacteria bacterium]
MGRRISQLRKNLGYSQEGLAEVASVSAAFLAHLEVGSRQCSLTVLARLAQALEVAPWQLLAEDKASAESPTPPTPAQLVRQIAQDAKDLDEADLQLVSGLVQRLKLGPGPRRRANRQG